MNRLAYFISTMDGMLDTRGKRHLAGGIMLSASLLFAGLAITIFTLKDDISKNIQLTEGERQDEFYDL